MSAPLVVNTVDGAVWTRRDGSRDGEALYAPEKCGTCPAFVMVTLTELAELGIVGSAGALPVPVGPEPQAVDAGPVVKPLALHEAQIDALAASGNRAVNDAVHEDLCACDAWPERCLSSGGFFQGYWDMGGLETAIPAVLGLWEQMRGGELAALKARVAELEAERHVTNEALDDAVQALRADRVADAVEYGIRVPDGDVLMSGCLTDRREQESRLGRYRDVWPDAVLVQRPVFHGEWAEAAPGPDAVTAVFSPVASLREPDGEFHSALHHAYKVGHDLPETGGA